MYRRILCPACDREIDVAPDGLVPDHGTCPAAGFKALPEAPPFFPGVPARINGGGVCTGAFVRADTREILYCERQGRHQWHVGGTLPTKWVDAMVCAGSSEPAVEA